MNLILQCATVYAHYEDNEDHQWDIDITIQLEVFIMFVLKSKGINYNTINKKHTFTIGLTANHLKHSMQSVRRIWERPVFFLARSRIKFARLSSYVNILFLYVLNLFSTFPISIRSCIGAQLRGSNSIRKDSTSHQPQLCVIEFN